MNSNVFSKLMPTRRSRSFYEELRVRDEGAEDVEDRAGLLDEENLNHQFHDYDLDQAEGLGDSRITSGSAHRPGYVGGGRDPVAARIDATSRWLSRDDEGDNDVPASLLVETDEMGTATAPERRTQMAPHSLPTSIPGPATRRNRAQWEATRTQHRLHHDEQYTVHQQAPHGAGGPKVLGNGLLSADARKKAEWRWANVSNLDIFIKDVYDYYQGCGLWCILLERSLHLINVVFVAFFLTLLTQCIDYSKIPHSKKLSQIMVPQCTTKMSGMWNLGLWLFVFYFIWKSIQYMLDLRRLFNVREFYVHLLEIPEHDMQTVTWQDIVARIMALRDKNAKTATYLTPAQRRWIGSQSKERLDASDIANRLMRRENYFIALFNKDVLDLSIPLPFARHRQLLSRSLEWTLMFSILDFVFDEQGQVNQEFLKSDRRGELSQKLRNRFLFAAFMNLILAPFLAGYLMIVYFLTYYQEYQKNPSSLGLRTYTPLAEWKFREFNELPHLFKKRLNMSHPYASHYLDQFPKIKTEMMAKTVAFIAGALVTVLAIASLLDPELFLGFEITHERTVLFYVTVFGTIWAVARGSISEENAVFDPEFAMRNVIEYTHYEPDHWKNRLHSFDVKVEFAELYKPRIVVFAEEILSILITPAILFVSLPRSSDQIIDFFREFTIHVDGLGYVCSFAEFDFKKGVGQSKKPSDAVDIREDYYSTKHGKMEASYYGFLGNYGNYLGTPKAGAGSHLPPNLRHQFHPPPAWPVLSSPTLAADLQSSRMGRSERPRSRAPARTPRFGPAIPQPSPMASILLDPHHQPPATAPRNKSSQRNTRQARGNGYQGESDIIEESVEDGQDGPDGPDGPDSSMAKQGEEEETYGSAGALDESTWQTSPTKTLSRENSAAHAEEPVAGVVGMIYQFNQAQLNRRPAVR